MEKEDVLEESEEPEPTMLSYLADQFSSLFRKNTLQEGVSKNLAAAKQQASINIFTVASGLLYEVRYILARCLQASTL